MYPAIVTYNCLFARVWHNAGQWGNEIFFLITGYFVINRARPFKALTKIWRTTCFYSVAFYLILHQWMAVRQPDGEAYGFFVALTPIIHNTYWFITDYLFLMLTMPFIIKIVENITLKQYRYILIFLFLVTSLIPTLDIMAGKTILLRNGAGGFFNSPFFQCLFIVLAGGYLHKDPRLKEWPVWFWIIALLAGMGGIFAYNVSVFHAEGNAWAKIVNLTQPFNFMISISLLCLFLKVQMGSISIINHIASTVFGVYLIHENPFVRIILWNQIFPNEEAFASEYFVFHVLIEAVCVFVCCAMIEMSRKILFTQISDGVKNI